MKLLQHPAIELLLALARGHHTRSQTHTLSSQHDRRMQHDACPPPPRASPVRVAWDLSVSSARRGGAWVHKLGVIDREHSQWGRYVRTVYGHHVQLPFDLRRLRWFWWWAPGSSNLTRAEVPVWRDVAQTSVWIPGLRSERHLAEAGFFVQHEVNDDFASKVAASPSDAAASGGRIEVMRVSHPQGESLKSAYGPEAAADDQVWYWHAPGSGIYLSVGRTLSVPNRSVLLATLRERGAAFTEKTVHVSRERGLRLCDGCSDRTGELYRDFGVLWWSDESSPSGTTQRTQRICEIIRKAGVDTVQLTHAFQSQRFEIIDCRQAHLPSDAEKGDFNGACPAGSNHLTNYAGAPCNCSSSLRFLNCAGSAFSQGHAAGAPCVTAAAAVTRMPHF